MRDVREGSPQGTRLGNILFIATINDIEDNWTLPQQISTYGSEHSDQDLDSSDDCYGLRFLAGRIGALQRFDSGVAAASTPHKVSGMASVLRYDDESGRNLSTASEAMPGSPGRQICGRSQPRGGPPQKRRHHPVIRTPREEDLQSNGMRRRLHEHNKECWKHWHESQSCQNTTFVRIRSYAC